MCIGNHIFHNIFFDLHVGSHHIRQLFVPDSTSHCFTIIAFLQHTHSTDTQIYFTIYRRITFLNNFSFEFSFFFLKMETNLFTTHTSYYISLKFFFSFLIKQQLSIKYSIIHHLDYNAFIPTIYSRVMFHVST